MKIALCTTTVNIPHVLKLYRACDPDVHFFVAVDDKTPTFGFDELQIPNVTCMRGEYWKCSGPIGWSNIQRRNIALLEALKWGADIVVSIDDDNIAISPDYFQEFKDRNSWWGLGLRTDSNQKWFDPGQLLVPPAKHRGFPRAGGAALNLAPTASVKIGVSAGLCLGDPDVDAVTRIERSPLVMQASTIGDAGVLVHPNTWTVFNSQNTAMIRDLVPAWFMWPGVHRMDDIYASLIVQRVMRERWLHVHFGKPFIYQQRNEHNLIKDLRGEIDGYENVSRLADILDHIVLPGKSVIQDVRWIWDTLAHAEWVPTKTCEAARAWLDDCESAMA